MMPVASESLGDNLIFIFSQPRAGSTMLQRILGCHPAIHTVSEPWVMLPSFLALRPEGYGSEICWRYSRKGQLLQRALREFIAELPDGSNTYFEGIRRMHSHLYQAMLGRSGKQFFLDKTPNYFYIIPEIRRTFPRAKLLFLLRNPLAVLSSVVDTWVGSSLFGLMEFKDPLLAAPRLLLEELRLLADNCLVIHYEKLVSEPEFVVRPICQWLGIEFVPEMVEYGRDATPQFSLGDHKGVYLHRRPDGSHLDCWRDRLKDAQLWRLTRDYLQQLGPETIDGLGYSFQALKSIVDQRKPPNYRFRPTLSLEDCLGEPTWRKNLWGNVVRLERACRRKGIVSVAAQAARRVAAALVP